MKVRLFTASSLYFDSNLSKDVKKKNLVSAAATTWPGVESKPSAKVSLPRPQTYVCPVYLVSSLYFSVNRNLDYFI